MTKPEKKLQDKAIQYLKDNDIYYINQFGNGWSAKGAPDLIVCINGKFVAFELKFGFNRKADAQTIHEVRIRRSGGRHYTPYNFEDFKNIVEGIKNGRM